MPRSEDNDSIEITLDDTQSISGQSADGWLEVETDDSEELHIHVDNGTTGGQPAQYTMTVHAYKSRHDDWMFDAEYTGETSRSWSIPAVNRKVRIDFTNTSGSNNETYRVTVEAIRK